MFETHIHIYKHMYMCVFVYIYLRVYQCMGVCISMQLCLHPHTLILMCLYQLIWLRLQNIQAPSVLRHKISLP